MTPEAYAALSFLWCSGLCFKRFWGIFVVGDVGLLILQNATGCVVRNVLL